MSKVEPDELSLAPKSSAKQRRGIAAPVMIVPYKMAVCGVEMVADASGSSAKQLRGIAAPVLIVPCKLTVSGRGGCPNSREDDVSELLFLQVEP